MEMSFSKIDWNEEGSAREKIYFFVVLALIVFMFLRVLWLPTLDKIKGNKGEIKNIKLQTSTLEKFIDLDKKLASAKPAKAAEEIDKEIQTILSKSSKNPQTVITDVVNKMTGRDALGSMTLESISFQPLNALGGYASIPIALSVQGTFSALQNYLSRLEKIEYLFTIDNIKFAESENHTGLIKADIAAKLYVGFTGVKPAVPQKKNGENNKT